MGCCTQQHARFHPPDDATRTGPRGACGARRVLRRRGSTVSGPTRAGGLGAPRRTSPGDAALLALLALHAIQLQMTTNPYLTFDCYRMIETKVVLLGACAVGTPCRAVPWGHWQRGVASGVATGAGHCVAHRGRTGGGRMGRRRCEREPGLAVHPCSGGAAGGPCRWQGCGCFCGVVWLACQRCPQARAPASTAAGVGAPGHAAPCVGGGAAGARRCRVG